MASKDAWPVIHTERRALVVDLEPLSDEQWATPSLCGGWSVRDVLGHMVATARKTPGKFFGDLIGAGFSFDRMTAKDVAKETAGPPAQTLDNFKALLDATSHPPGPIEAMVGEAVVHGEDIRRPLGIARGYPTDVLTQVAEFYGRSNLLIGGKKRIAGLTLKAEDAEWTTGAGPLVSGPMLAIVLVVAGRKAGLDGLSGEGVATLASRL